MREFYARHLVAVCLRPFVDRVGAWRTRLEPAVRPQVLVGPLRDPALDLAVHARGIRLDRRTGEVGPRRFDVQFIAVRGHYRHRHHHPGIDQTGDARNHRQRSRRHAEERHEDRVFGTVVHVRQVVERHAAFHRAQGGTQIRSLARDQHRFIEAFTPALQPAVPDFVGLAGVDRDSLHLGGDADATGVKSGEVRRDQDQGPGGRIEQMLATDDADKALDLFPRAAPEHRVIERRARDVAKAAPAYRIPISLGELRKADPKVRSRNASARPCDPPKRVAEQRRHTRTSRDRPPIAGIDASDPEPREQSESRREPPAHAASCGTGSAPAGTL